IGVSHEAERYEPLEVVAACDTRLRGLCQVTERFLIDARLIAGSRGVPTFDSVRAQQAALDEAELLPSRFWIRQQLPEQFGRPRIVNFGHGIDQVRQVLGRGNDLAELPEGRQALL